MVIGGVAAEHVQPCPRNPFLTESGLYEPPASGLCRRSNTGRERSGCERTPDPGEVGSSTRPRPTILERGAVAQLGERVLCKHEVTGSIPVSSTKSYSPVLFTVSGSLPLSYK
jgi:hypothetical protein